MCKKSKNQSGSNQLPSVEPLPGPSNSNIQTVEHLNTITEERENANKQRGQSDVLTAPELQLDFFSDSSSDSSDSDSTMTTSDISSRRELSNNRNNNDDVEETRLLYDRSNAQASGTSYSSRNNIYNDNNSGRQMRLYNRWLNYNYNRRRFYNNATRGYIPHQRLWQQQQHVQEMNRRFMSSNYAERETHFDNYGINNGSQSISPSYWHRRG